MKFEIKTKKFKDSNIESLVIKMFEFFATKNAEREEQIQKNKNKEETVKLLKDLCDYIETGLKNKFSQNFCIFVNENPDYAVKYDRSYLLSLKYLKYEIIVIKVPFISVPTMFSKKHTENELEELSRHQTQHGDKIKSKLEQITYYNKYFHQVNSKAKNLENFNEELFTKIITDNISYYCIKYCQEKNLSNLALSIQKDLSEIQREYSWCVIVSKKQIYSNFFIGGCDVVYHSRFQDRERSLQVNALKDIEIFIYKKSPVFESVLKNIVTGRFYEVEFKHFVILLSVIIFFVIMLGCKRDYSDNNLTHISYFEEKVCYNKRTILSTMGLVFIFTIISSLVRKKLDKSKRK